MTRSNLLLIAHLLQEVVPLTDRFIPASPNRRASDLFFSNSSIDARSIHRTAAGARRRIFWKLIRGWKRALRDASPKQKAEETRK
jgi:hypothetical protein